MKLAMPLSLCAIMILSTAQHWPGAEPLPSALIDKIERKISAFPCIGSMKKWDRQYSYKAWMEGTIYHLDTTAIKFEFSEAGRFEFRARRRFILDPHPMIDDRAYKIAYGEFDLKTDRATLTTCGQNMPGE